MKDCIQTIFMILRPLPFGLGVGYGCGIISGQPLRFFFGYLVHVIVQPKHYIGNDCFFFLLYCP